MEPSRDDLGRAGALAIPTGIERGVGLRALFGVLGLAAQPVRCGRFTLLDMLGAGGMGEVYRAHDPELRREVAIKVLREAGGEADTLSWSSAARELGGERMQLEARALARLGHPNVVQVLALGSEGGRTWIAMELVVGVSLARWSATQSPGSERFDRALAILRAAGEGLAAAHAAGLVHRDFKPANVLVGDDGQVKVADFGLAQADRAPIGDAPSRTALEHTDTRRTRASMVVGTPRYMAPEQASGRGADARSDQFAFAVTAWEVLAGSPPFGDHDAHERIARIQAGAIDVRAPLPTALRRVLVRALAADPQDRHASQRALLDAWDRALAPRRARWPWLAAVPVAVALVLAVPRGACDGSGAREAFARIWDASRRASLADALHDTGVPWADDAVAGVDAALHQHALAWRSAQIAVCEASRASPEREATLDRQGLCMAHAIAITDAWLVRLEHASPASAERAVASAQALPLPDGCASDSASARPEDPQLRRDLDAAVVARLAGEPLEAARIAQDVAARAQRLEQPRVRAEALLIAALALVELSGDDVEPLLGEAHALAIADRAPTLAFDIATRATTWRARQGHRDEAQRWLRHAEADAARLLPAPIRDVALDRARCAVLEADGQLAEALPVCTGALARLDDSGIHDGELRDKLRTAIAGLEADLGHHDVALALNAAMLDEAERSLGPSHPRTGGMHLNFGRAAQSLGEYALADVSYQKASAIFRAAYGDHHRWVVSALMNLGSLRQDQRDFAGAEAAAEEALAACGERRDAATARVLHNLAENRRTQGRAAEALVLLDRVALIEAEVLPADHLQTAMTHHSRGNVLIDLDRLDEAELELAQARRLLERSGTADLAAIEASQTRLVNRRAQ